MHKITYYVEQPMITQVLSLKMPAFILQSS